MSFNVRFLLVILVSTFLRFWKLGVLPVANVSQPFLMRFPSALCGVISVACLYFIVKKVFKSESVAFWSAAWLSIMPWHVMESRVISPVLYASTLTLLLVMFLIQFKDRLNKTKKVLLILVTGLAMRFVYPEFWIFKQLSFISFPDFLYNVFKFLSGEFLFFKNDTFWWGGMRESGVMLLLMIIPFLIGIYQIIFYQKKVVSSWIFGLFSLVLIVSAASPFAPESREFFLTTPLLAVITGIGIENFVHVMKKLKWRGNILMVLFFVFTLYQSIIFWRLYTVHHAARIRAEIHNVKVAY